VSGEDTNVKGTHLHRWGAVWILVALFAGSLAAQAWTMAPDIEASGWTYFWAATFENWQSEWLQLIFQAILLMGAKHWIFEVEAEDTEEMKGKIGEILDRVKDLQGPVR
jgi:hypothetical protein